ncbi:hypothetical protein MHH52_07005 [Paenibacillus sp. FSL K6-0276]|uniref:hypothetical protein n=1 Tax=Paenibacillus sp. FSL K6-0276 TaxID=2921450 RepID=UPI0030ECBD12
MNQHVEQVHVFQPEFTKLEIEVISADQIDEAWKRVLASDVRYRFVIDISAIWEQQVSWKKSWVLCRATNQRSQLPAFLLINKKYRNNGLNII